MTARSSVRLIQPVTNTPALGVNVVVSWGAGVSNDFGHTTVTLWLLGVTDSLAYSLVGLPSSSRVIAPDGAATLTSAVTVAIGVTVSWDTAAVDEARQQSCYQPTSIAYWRQPPLRSDYCRRRFPRHVACRHDRPDGVANARGM